MLIISCLMISCSPRYPLIIREKVITDDGCFYKVNGMMEGFSAPCNFANVGDTLTSKKGT